MIGTRHLARTAYQTTRQYLDPYRLARRLRTDENINLHLGCGKKHIDGYVNVDFRWTFAVDYVCDVRRLPIVPDSVDRIESYHMIEHISRPDVAPMLKRWWTLLKPDGELVIECPDFDLAVVEYVAGVESRIDNIFGLQRFPGDAHLFGYNFRRLRDLLTGTGFVAVREEAPQDAHTQDEPCLRVVCRKGESA